MRKTIPLLLASALVLTSCGAVRDSRYNPFNWFGRGESRQIENVEGRNPLLPRRSLLAAREKDDNRTPIQQVTLLAIERNPSGAILRAEGVTAYQAAYDLGLRLVEDVEVPEGTLRYAFVAYQPRRAVGTEASRRVVTAIELTDAELASVRRIEVVGAANVMTARR
ncbi:hypothetical protein [Pseudooceanicola onchidii]|uniref:hypothetical protein n=1 Tax=Pseudooceanicola onchidii TaxID=2562279 RepID=UPI0010AA96E4|nr:hypothetical protein [Pseudooceanicola onchidii]